MHISTAKSLLIIPNPVGVGCSLILNSAGRGMLFVVLRSSNIKGHIRMGADLSQCLLMVTL